MEEQDKYYVPKIEEFHVGFEFEYKETFLDGTVKTQEQYDSFKWLPSVFNIGDGPYIQRALIDVNYSNNRCGVRVKYLDKEDIESLGFKLIDKKSSTMFDEPIEDYYILYKLGNNYIEYNSWYSSEVNNDGKRYLKKNEKYTIFSKQFIKGENNFVTNIKFSGTIKNKSELKFILKSIGVLKENK